MDDVVEVMARKIMLAMQCHDFGSEGDNGSFVTTPAKIDMLTECCDKAARAALSALSAGWVVVPRKITPEMAAAFLDAIRCPWDDRCPLSGTGYVTKNGTRFCDCQCDGYEAMLSAAPAPK